MVAMVVEGEAVLVREEEVEGRLKSVIRGGEVTCHVHLIKMSVLHEINERPS